MKKYLIFFLLLSTANVLQAQKNIIAVGTSYDRLRISNDPETPVDYPTNEVLVDFEYGMYGKRGLIYGMNIGAGHSWGGGNVDSDLHFIRQDILKLQFFVRKYYEIIPKVLFGTQLEFYGSSADARSFFRGYNNKPRVFSETDYTENIYLIGLRPSMVYKPRDKWMLEVNMGHFGFGELTQDIEDDRNTTQRYRGNFQDIRYIHVKYVRLKF